MIWSQEVIDTLAKLWSEGNSASQVAYLLNEQFGGRITKNAVIGKIHRLIYQGKLARREDYRPMKKKLPAAPETRPPKTVKKVAVAKKAAPIRVAPKVASPEPNNIFTLKLAPRPVHRGGLVTIDMATGCLYVVTSTPKGVHLFCNKQKRAESQYCQEHHDRCHVKATAPIKKALRVVR